MQRFLDLSKAPFRWLGLISGNQTIGRWGEHNWKLRDISKLRTRILISTAIDFGLMVALPISGDVAILRETHRLLATTALPMIVFVSKCGDSMSNSSSEFWRQNTPKFSARSHSLERKRSKTTGKSCFVLRTFCGAVMAGQFHFFVLIVADWVDGRFPG
jgi:hypothetical protein